MAPIRTSQARLAERALSKARSSGNQKELSKAIMEAEIHGVNCFEVLQATNLLAFLKSKRNIRRRGVRFPNQHLEAEYINPEESWTREMLFEHAHTEHEQEHPQPFEEFLLERQADKLFTLNGRKIYPLHVWN